MAQITNGSCDLKTALLLRLGWYKSQRCWGQYGLLDLEGFAAAPAQSIYRAELHQAAIITT